MKSTAGKSLVGWAGPAIHTKVGLAVLRRLDPEDIEAIVTCCIEQPDGVALPGEFHLRYVFRKDIPGLFETARGLKP
jgi:hypothetical protein